MKRTRPQEMSVEKLVERFVAIAIEQDKAIRTEANAKYNKLYGEMDVVIGELRRRPGDQRRTLIPLLAHSNAQVRLKAAIATLALVPERARKTLQNITDWAEYPQAPYAFGMIRALDDGSYKPT
jgi:hypothetical protein